MHKNILPTVRSFIPIGSHLYFEKYYVFVIPHFHFFGQYISVVAPAYSTVLPPVGLTIHSLSLTHT